MGRKGRLPIQFTEEQILEAIKGCNAITSTVAKRLHCDWMTAKRNIEKHESTIQAFENERQTAGDIAETKLMDNVKKGDMGAIKYFLSKKFKDRGYGDEITTTLQTTEDNSIHITIDD